MYGVGGKFIGYLIVAYRLKSLFSIEWYEGTVLCGPLLSISKYNLAVNLEVCHRVVCYGRA